MVFDGFKIFENTHVFSLNEYVYYKWKITVDINRDFLFYIKNKQEGDRIKTSWFENKITKSKKSSNDENGFDINKNDERRYGVFVNAITEKITRVGATIPPSTAHAYLPTVWRWWRKCYDGDALAVRWL